MEITLTHKYGYIGPTPYVWS